MKTLLLQLILHQFHHQWPSPCIPDLSINTPPSLHCFSGGWRHGVGSCQGLLQQKCEKQSLPYHSETSIAASSQPIALINSAPGSPFQHERGGSPAVNPNLNGRAQSQLFRSPAVIAGEPQQLSQALQHCLGHWWPGFGGCDAQGFQCLPCLLAVLSWRGDVTCAGTH